VRVAEFARPGKGRTRQNLVGTQAFIRSDSVGWSGYPKENIRVIFTEVRLLCLNGMIGRTTRIMSGGASGYGCSVAPAKNVQGENYGPAFVINLKAAWDSAGR